MKDALSYSKKVRNRIVPPKARPKPKAKIDPDTKTEPIQVGNVGSYQEANRRAVTGHNIEAGHVPSKAAKKANFVRRHDRKSTAAEEKLLYGEGTTVAMPREMYQRTRTYGGNNTAAQSTLDGENLLAAQTKDLEVQAQLFRDAGWSSSDIAKMQDKIRSGNRGYGIG